MLKYLTIAVVFILLTFSRSALAQSIVIDCQGPRTFEDLGGQPMGCIFIQGSPQGRFQIALQSDLGPLNQQLSTTNAQITALDGTISTLQQQVTTLQSALIQQQQDDDKLKALLLQTLDDDSILQNPANLNSLEQKLQVVFDSRYSQKASN